MTNRRQTVALIRSLVADILDSIDAHENPTVTEHEVNGCTWEEDSNYRNKNHGKTALKRKITMLRQELLNYERMLDDAN